MPSPRFPLAARSRQSRFPNSAPFVPTTIDVGNTVPVTGSVTATISGSIVANPTTSAAFVASQITITSGGAATAIFAISASTIFREVTNPTASNATVFLGPVGVTVTTGHYLPGGWAFDQQYNSAALYGVALTGSVTVSTFGW